MTENHHFRIDDTEAGAANILHTRRQKSANYEKPLKPVYISMKLVGLHYDYDVPHPKRISCLKVYHFIVVLFLWLNCLRYLGSFSFGVTFDVSKILLQVYFFWGAISATEAGILCKHNHHIFQQWWNYLNHFDVAISGKINKNQSKRILATLCIAWLSIIIYVAKSASVSNDHIFNRFIRPFMLPFIDECSEYQPPIALLIASLFAETLAWMACIHVLVYFLLIVLGVADEFNRFNKDFQKCIDVEPEVRSLHKFTGDLQYWRGRHSMLCQLVSKLDKGFGLYILLVFLSAIPICCLIIFNMLMTTGFQTKEVIEIWITYGPILCFCISLLLTITYVGTKLNTEATKSKSILYSLNLKGDNWTMDMALQYQTFHNKLSEGHIGITAWNLFYINKLTIKMVILMIVSYSLILLKFGQGVPQRDRLCEFNSTTDIITTDVIHPL